MRKGAKLPTDFNEYLSKNRLMKVQENGSKRMVEPCVHLLRNGTQQFLIYNVIDMKKLLLLLLT